MHRGGSIESPTGDSLDPEEYGMYQCVIAGARVRLNFLSVLTG